MVEVASRGNANGLALATCLLMAQIFSAPAIYPLSSFFDQLSSISRKLMYARGASRVVKRKPFTVTWSWNYQLQPDYKDGLSHHSSILQIEQEKPMAEYIMEGSVG